MLLIKRIILKGKAIKALKEYVNNPNIKYPYVQVMADTFVKKAQELVDLGYQIHSGLKFGTHYRVYNYESEHAPWLIHITQKNHNWLDIARMIRVGHGVNKIIVLAYEKYWISLKWTKP